MALEKAKYSTNAGSPDAMLRESGTPANVNQGPLRWDAESKKWLGNP